jgi:hypothetical protein
MMNLILAAALASQATATDAKACHADTVFRVVKDKDEAAPFVLRLASGRQLRILGQDFIDPRTWRRGDPVSICLTDDTDVVEVTDTTRDEWLQTWTDARPR